MVTKPVLLFSSIILSFFFPPNGEAPSLGDLEKEMYLEQRLCIGNRESHPAAGAVTVCLCDLDTWFNPSALVSHLQSGESNLLGLLRCCRVHADPVPVLACSRNPAGVSPDCPDLARGLYID